MINGFLKYVGVLIEVYTMLIFYILFREDSVIHDSFTCQIPSNADVRAWPTQRAENEPNYVGTSGDQITLAKDGQCPEKCRPQYHEDWTLC